MVYKDAASGDSLTPTRVQQLDTNRGVIISGTRPHYIGNSKVRVNAGVFALQEDLDHASISQTDITLPAADATNPRYTTIEVNNSGTVSGTDGSAAASPLIPSLTDESTVVAVVKINAQSDDLNDDGTDFGNWNNSGNFVDGSTEYTSTTNGAKMDKAVSISSKKYIKMQAKLQKDTAVAGQEAKVHINTANDATGNGYCIKIDGTSAELCRVDTGSETALISGGTIAADTQYTILAERDDDNVWRLYVDGTQVGSDKSDGKYQTTSHVVLHNVGTNAGHWDDIIVTTADAQPAYDLTDLRQGEALPFLLKHEYSDSTTSSSASAVVLKTHTILANTFSQGFWVFAFGVGDVTTSTANAFTVQVRVATTVKGQQEGSIASATYGAGDFSFPWSILVYIPSDDSDWTPSSNVAVDVRGAPSNATVSCRGFVIWGR